MPYKNYTNSNTTKTLSFIKKSGKKNLSTKDFPDFKMRLRNLRYRFPKKRKKTKPHFKKF